MALDARKKRESSHLCRKVTRSPNEQTARGEAMRKQAGDTISKKIPRFKAADL